MELETSKEQAYDMQLSAKKPKIKIGTMVIGIMLITIPIFNYLIYDYARTLARYNECKR